MRVIRVTAGLVLAAALLAGCSSSGSKASSPTTTGTSAAALSGASECTSSTQLKRVLLTTMASGLLSVRWETSPALKSSERSYVVTIGSKQIGLKFVGQEVFRFVFDLGGTGGQTNLTSAYTETGGVATLVVPMSLLGLEAPVEWSATITSSGSDVARCPTAGTVAWATSPT
jgi:hypothetical protein